MKNLTQIEIDKQYKVVKVRATEPILSRLVSMGFARDAEVVALKSTATKQTYKIRVEDSEVALRREEAELVFVKAEGETK
jgi:ferrous iron transport protein A